MRIAFILPSLTNTGPIVVNNTLINKLIKSGNVVDVYYFDSLDSSLIFNCNTYKINFNQRINFERYEIVHSSMYRSDKYIFKWIKTVDRSKTKFLSTVHQDIYSNLKYNYNSLVALIYSQLWYYYLRSFDHICFISKKIASLYSSKFTSSSVVYNGIDIHLSDNNLDLNIIDSIQVLRSNNKIVLGCYASINRGKGLDQVIELLRFSQEYAFIIIGKGNEKRNLMKLVKTYKLEDRVLFFDYLNQPYNYLQYLDFYVMPSRNEGFGLALVEAAYAKIPVICSDIDVFREIFDDTQVSFFELENIKSMNNAIIYALDNKGKLINNAFDNVCAKYTANHMVANYLDIYEKTLKL